MDLLFSAWFVTDTILKSNRYATGHQAVKASGTGIKFPVLNNTGKQHLKKRW